MVTKNEVLGKLKELKDCSKEVELSLERDGISITDMNKEKLFNNNLKNAISAIEALVRNEPSERPILRLQREIPDAYNNIRELKQIQPGKLNSADLDKLAGLIKYFEDVYEEL
ncbi:hypothetical protein J4440_04440 [Candidatus Woesearchaeota archaeon]|nr:hypothetical protein [Candidatus Woesearchaeota archaeon]